MTEMFQSRFLAARRQYIASQFAQLNDMQCQAVLTTQGPLLLLAGAGSGKTTVLINRIANLLRFGCASDSDFLTNKAANEMKERLSALLGPQAEDIWAMTFHSACCRILRRDIDRMGYTRSFTIYDTSDSERIMKAIISDLGLDDKTSPARYVLGAISRQKDRMIAP